jgi:hypothetical protein
LDAYADTPVSYSHGSNPELPTEPKRLDVEVQASAVGKLRSLRAEYLSPSPFIPPINGVGFLAKTLKNSLKL